MNTNTNFFIPFSKTDDEKRTVIGYASTEAIDSQGEIVEKDAIMNALPDYLKFGNIREMHQASAVGKTQSAIMDDKGLIIQVKIVDDNAWKKVKEGVYNGFSIGGRIVEKVGNTIKQLVLSEISVVDRPANPEALFTVVKFDHPMTKNETQTEEVVTETTVEAPSIEDVAKAEVKRDLAALRKEAYADVQFADQKVTIQEKIEKFGAAHQELAKAEKTTMSKVSTTDEAEKEIETKIEEMSSFMSQQVCIFDAAEILNMTQELVFMIADRIWAEKDTADLMIALDKLKAVACQTLEDGQEYVEKVSAMVAEVEERSKMDDSDYAFVNSKGKQFLAIKTAEQMKKSLVEFGYTPFESEDQKILAARILENVTETMKMDLPSAIAKASKQEMGVEIRKGFAPTHSTYFAQLEAALG